MSGSHQRYPLLFSPLDLGFTQLKNRAIKEAIELAAAL